MSYRTLVSMNIAIIGSGYIAAACAEAFALAGHEVLLAAKEGQEIGLDPLLETFDTVNIYSIEKAAELADIIIIATEPKDVREIAYWLGDVRKKVIIDATANVFTPDHELVKTVCGIKSITGSQNIVKVFHTKGYEELLKPLFRRGHIDIVMVGDSKKAKEMTKILAIDMGFESFYDFGGSEAIPLFNETTRCWRNLMLATMEAQKAIRVRQ